MGNLRAKIGTSIKGCVKITRESSYVLKGFGNPSLT